MERLEFPISGLKLDSEPLPPFLGQCMICGQANEQGVRLRFHRLVDPDGTMVGVGAESTVPDHFQGFDGLLHGGGICAFLDDAMWWAVYTTHRVVTVTADLELRFRQPIPISSSLRVEGITGPGRRIYPAASRLLDPAGRVLAEASGRFVVLPPKSGISLSV